jgi:ABC-type lipoprotein release transport system permease subunit
LGSAIVVRRIAKDSPVLASVVLILIAVAIAATWAPALRAARVDPSEALRSD